MADAILIALTRLDPRTVQVRCEAAHRSAEAPHPLPDTQVIDDLLFQIRGGAPAAGRALAEILGAILFADAPGAIAREALSDDPWQLVCLQADRVLNDWPWELALDPVTGRCPVAEGLAMVRIGGPNAGPGHLPERGLVVAPAHDPVRLDALKALTRGLARKAGLEIEQLSPASAPGVRARLEAGTALLHLDAPAADGGVLVDTQRAEIPSLGIDANTWLAVVSGGEAGAPVARAIRQAGAQVVIARQMDLDPQQSAALDRKLYQCLAKGLTPIEAVRAARAALARRDGDSSAWAAPVLWSARWDARVPAAVPYPPRAFMIEPEEAPAPAPTTPAPTMAPRAVEAASARHPVSALTFISQTIERLQLGGDPRDPALSGRLAVLRELGGDATATPPADLPESARLDWLADRLVESVDRPAMPLQRPANLEAQAEHLAAIVGARQSDVLALTRALVASPVVAISGDGARAIADAVCTRLFSAHPVPVTGGPDVPLIGSPGPSRQSEGDGWLYSVAAANWRLDEDWTAAPSARPPTRRLPVITRTATGAWRAFDAAWLMVSAADALDSGPLRAMLDALQAGVLTGFDESGFRFQLDLPPDLRVVLIEPDRLPDWVPLIEFGAPVERKARWLAAAEARFGAALDTEEAQVRAALAAHLDPILAVYSAISGAPSAQMGAAALQMAIVHGGPVGDALDEALLVLLAPRVRGVARATLRAWLAGDPDGMVAAADEQITRGLARYLDRVDPVAVPRIDALAQLGPLAFVTEAGLTAPAVALPRLIAALDG